MSEPTNKPIEQMTERELDRAIADEVVGDLTAFEENDDRGFCGVAPGVGTAHLTPRHYSADIGAAWSVVEKMRADGWHFDASDFRECDRQGRRGWFSRFWKDGVQFGPPYECCSTMPKAISIAALKAKRSRP